MKRLLLALIPCLVTPSVLAQTTIDFTSTPVTGVLADALAAGPDGSLWSVNQTANTISHVTFPDLHVGTFNVTTTSAGLAGITAGPDGNMWFTESTAKKIGRIDTGGTISEFPIPANAAPPQRIFSGPNGTLWSFNACIFYGCSRFIVTTTAGASTELPLQVPGTASFAPGNCTLGSDGNVWCIGSETIPSPFSSQFKVARISPTGGYTSFVPPRGFQGSAIVAAPDGNVWYTWEEAGSATGVARVSPAGVITEFIIPTGKPQSWIFGLALGADGNLYFADRQTSILYELVLSTATDSGTATINSGTISIDIPEDIVAVSNQSGSAGIHAQDAAHCPAVAFTIKSGGSFGGIEWEEAKAPDSCTDMLAKGEARRGEEGDSPTAFASCSVKPATAAPDPALSPTLTIETLGLDAAFGGVVTKVGWQTCEVLAVDVLQCSSPGTAMAQGQAFSVTFTITGFESGLTRVTCASNTPEITTYDNEDTFLAFIGDTELFRGRDLVNVNIRSATGH
jgi:streptogramin lyase